MTNHIDWKNIISWCKEYITVRNVMKISVIGLMITTFLACITVNGSFLGIKFVDAALGFFLNIAICAAWIGIKVSWEAEQKEREEEYERRRNRIRY